MTATVRESDVALAQAQAISLVVRGLDPVDALEELARLVDDAAVLSAAGDRCLQHRGVSAAVATSAVDLLATAAMLARGGGAAA